MLRRFCLPVLILILTACGGNSPDKTPEIEATLTPLPTTTLNISYSQTELAAGLEELRASFEKAYPSVTVILTQSDVETFQNEFQNGAGADLLIGSSAEYQFLLRKGYLVSLDRNLLDQDILLVPAQTYQAVQQNEVPYAFPLRLDAPALFINGALVADDLTNLADILALKHPIQIGSDFFSTSGWLEIDNFVRPIAPDGHLDIQAETFTAYLQNLQALNETGLVQWVETLSVTEEVAVAVGSTRQIPALRAVWGDQLKVLPLVVDKPEDSYQLGDADLMMISLNATAENVQAAHQFMKWSVQPLQQDALSQATGLAPIWNTLTPDTQLQASANLSQNATYIPFNSPFYTETLPRYNTAIAQVLSGVLSPEEASTGLFTED